MDAFLDGKDHKTFNAGSDEFTAFTGVPTGGSKLRLAYRYNKRNVSLQIFRDVNGTGPGTERIFLDRSPLP